MKTLHPVRILKVDEKWSIEFDPNNNDRPLSVLRYGEPMTIGPEDWRNDVMAMFYALLATKHCLWDVEEFKIWKGIDPTRPTWASRGFACDTWENADGLLKLIEGNDPCVILRVVKRPRE